MSVTQQEINNKVEYFNILRAGMLQSVKTQFIHMAIGGDGSAALEGEIRKKYYPAWTTADFQKVCDMMGWDYNNTRMQ